MTLWIILGVLFLLILWFVATYNGFIRLKTRADEAWSDIDIQLRRRYDLIPNLIETVKGYASHERNLFERVTEARVRAMAATAPGERAEAEETLSGTLKSLFAVSENYPQLRANENFLELQRELTDTEDKIQAARRFYNTNARDLNIKIDSFPSKIVADIFHFTPRDFFEPGDALAREPVKVQF